MTTPDPPRVATPPAYRNRDGSSCEVPRLRAWRLHREKSRQSAPAHGGARQPSPAPPGRRQEAEPQDPPWQYAKHVSTNLETGVDLRKLRRGVRRAQRAVLWDKSTLERVRGCGRVAIDDVTVRGKDGVAHFAGLATCGSIWACPVCSAKIRNKRATEVSNAAAAWHRAGNSLALATFTFPHDAGMKLASSLELIAGGFRRVLQGREWAGTPERHVPERPSKRGGVLPAKTYPARPGVRDRLGVAGTIRAIEVTHGGNGWHPHAHSMFFMHGDVTAERLVELILYLRKQWDSWVTEHGYRAPSRIRGVDVSVCDSAADAGAYIAKTQDGRSVGNEIARGDMKQGHGKSRTPFEILDSYRRTGNEADLALWHEYEQATKGHQAITWSRGLKQLVGQLDEERTDEEIAAEEVGGDDIAQIPPAVWFRIVSVPGLDSAVLDAAESGGLAGINELLGRHGIGKAHAPSQRGSPYE